MSAYERPRGSGRWVSSFQLHGAHVWTPGSPFPSKTAALEAERRHRDQLAARASDETCASFADRWLEEWPRPAASTRQLYEQAAERFAKEFGPTPLGEVERLSARTWALGVPRNLSKVIGTLYEDARNVGLVEDNPFANLRLPKTERTEEVAPPTPDEFRALLAATTVLGGYGSEFRALVQFAAWTGLRSGEIQGLKLEDIGENTINVQRSRKTDDSYGPPKNGQPRKIELLEPARVLDQVPRREGSPFVFHTPRGEDLNKSNLHYLWSRVRDSSETSLDRIAAGIKPIRFHDLRHFCATRLLELGADHFAVSVHLGHEDGGALVMARYGHPSKEAARERLRDLFAPASPAEGEITSRATSGEAS